MKAYITGPMTGIEAFNYPAFEAAARALRAQGANRKKLAEKLRGEGGETA